MSEKTTEFIPATELPEAEGTDIKVLCVENGEMKLKSMSGLGETAYDIVVKFITGYEEGSYIESTEIISGSYEAVVQKLDSGIMPKALVIYGGVDWNNCEHKVVEESIPYWNNHSYWGEGLWIGDYLCCFLRPDGTAEID